MHRTAFHRHLKHLGYIASLLPCLVACGTHANLSHVQSLADAASITQRSDGSYDVVCKDGDREVDTAAQIEANQVCVGVVPPPPNGHTVTIPTKSYESTAGGTIVVFGKNIWTGFISFNLKSNSASTTAYTITDGNSASWQLGTTGSLTFNRLTLPVTIVSNYTGDQTLTVSSEVYDLTNSPTSAPMQVSGRADAQGSQWFTALGLPQLDGPQTGETTPVSFTVTAQFFSNFAAGTGCERLVLAGGGMQSVTLDAQHLTATVNANDPFLITSPTCQSSRLPTPENSATDYLLTTSAVQISDPAY